MTRAEEDTGFDCAHCGTRTRRHPAGSYRNHCPVCLYSLHVDVRPGDRAADCSGQMAPVGLDHSGKKGFVLVHRCESCGATDRNKVAPDDNADALAQLSAGSGPPPA
ncbi:MAG: RNHCP domain-containing protein [Nocardioidaceae bacterium]|nr:MAG: RNHCP domain-containing protein [Nocardioidaceae bacterium]